MNKTFACMLLFCSIAAGTARAWSGEAGHLAADSVVQEATVNYDSLSAELSQLKSRLNDVEKEQYLEKVWKRKKYWKIGLASPKLERTDGEEMTWETDFSIFLQRGKTAYLHAKPVAGMVKFGIDWGFDLSYAKLKLKTVGGSDISGVPDGSVLSAMGVDLGMHKIDLGMHVGPSVSVNPWNHLIVAAYFHLMPVASGIVENDNFSYGFGCAMAAGISVAYKSLSVGVEGLWSTIKYMQASFDGDDEDDDYAGAEESTGNIFTTKDFKLKQKGPRFYVALRF